MIQLHAPDAAGQAAHKASQFGHVVQHNLMAAASPTLTTAKRLEAMERLFTAWPLLCREMAALEALAPRTSAAGYENANALQEMAHRVAEREAA